MLATDISIVKRYHDEEEVREEEPPGGADARRQVCQLRLTKALPMTAELIVVRL